MLVSAGAASNPTVLRVVEESFLRAPWGWALTAAFILALVKVWPVIKQLSIGEHARIREEYVAEIKALREELKALREENDTLRRDIRGLHDELAGMRRKSIQEQVSVMRVMPAVSEVLEDATDRAERAIQQGDEHE